MKLGPIIDRIPGATSGGNLDVEITGVTSDSREVERGMVFCAVRGLRSDGHDFIDKAVAAGAAAIVAERDTSASVPVIRVGSSAMALGILTAALAGDPAERLRNIGITGTNGKTTCSYLVESVVRAGGGSPGVIGTVNYRYGDVVKDAPYTTPVPSILHGQLAEFVAAGCTHAVMEVSSAALDMERTAGMGFDVGVFTNLTQDHLDLHGSMEAYRDAKAKLFSHGLRDTGVAVINADDPAAAAMIAAAGSHRVIRFSTRASSDGEVRVLSYESTVAGIRAKVHTPLGEVEVHSRALLGEYNVANLLTALSVGLALEMPLEAIARGLGDMTGVPGRVERVANDRGLDILVDYAHTPDALANVLAALRPLTRRRLICVFGCGGDRDPSKRPKMGAEVARGADLAVVTSDNPRTEDPRAILEQILPAVPSPFFVDPDRRTAIAAAVCEATPGDVVIIAGKGHEDYQILGTTKIHFDDREEAAGAAQGRPRWPAGEVAHQADGVITFGPADSTFDRVTIDGRSATIGDLYVAIVGERFDGHDFITQAAEAGATGAMVRRGYAGERPRGMTIIEVEDTRVALGRLAKHHRERWGRTVVGITGSSGKTTVKDMTAAALSPGGRVHWPKGSLNNETGVPLTLLGLRDYHRSAVIEMGMRGLGHIDYLGEMVVPDVGVVINAQKAHIGVVGSEDAIVQGKSEMFGRIAPGGTAIAPAGDERLLYHARGADGLITFGFEADARVRVKDYQLTGPGRSKVTLEYDGKTASSEIPYVGRHQAENAACAVSAAVAAGIDFAAATQALHRAIPSAMRGQIEDIGGRMVVIDCYNANPASMAAAISTLDELGTGKVRVAIVGDMLELGDSAAMEHERVGAQAAERGIEIIALGQHAGDVGRGFGRGDVGAGDPAEAATRALSMTRQGDVILVKGSRGMRMERVVEAMRAELGGTL